MAELREYKAFIESEPGTPMFRVIVRAESIDDAHKMLEVEYGEGTVFGLHNEEDANKPRA